MLVLSRREKQSLIIGQDIEIVILESKDGNVKVGINAPKSIKVYRKEIFDEIKDENKSALISDTMEIKGLIEDGI